MPRVFVLFICLSFLGCQRQNDKSAQEGSQLPAKVNLEPLIAIFPDWTGRQEYHFYSIMDGGNISEYAYLGTPVPKELMDLFDKKSAEDFKTILWGAYALGRVDSLFFLRVPAKQGAKEIAIYRPTSEGLIRTHSLANATCIQGYCTQTDSWLIDLNGDGLLDVVTRSLQQDPGGATLSDKIVSFSQNPDRTFTINEPQTFDRKRFELARIGK